MKKENISWEVFPIVMSLIVIFFIGVVVGMILQQELFIKSVIDIAEGLEGTTFNIEIDLNETLIVDRTMDKMNEFGVFNLTDQSNNGEIK